MEDKEELCGCNVGNKSVMSCSGASDVGLIAYGVACAMQVGNIRKINCLPMVAPTSKKPLRGLKQKIVAIQSIY